MGLSKRLSAVLIAGLALLLCGAGGGPQKGKQRSDFWDSVAHPGQRRFREAIARGRKVFGSVRSPATTTLARERLRKALRAFREAVQAAPERPEGHFWVGSALYELDQMKDAIAALERARRRDPLFGRSYDLAFKLGIAYSKIGKFAAAVREYGRAERLAARRQRQDTETRGSRAVLHGNAAEALMAIGRLDEAIQRYRDAIDLHSGYGLAWWGLAVALDRDEQISAAMAAVQRAIAYDPQMKRLSGPGVFFIPEGDVHYYLGLGYLAQRDTKRAREAFERFVAELPHSPWTYRARQHLAALGEPSTRPQQRKRLAPRPSDAAGPLVADDRARSSIRFRMRDYLPKIEGCYRKLLKRQPDLTGRLRVSFVVAPKGSVSRAAIEGSTLRSKPLVACVLKVIRAARFGKSGRKSPVKMIYPFEFKPR